MRMNTGLAELVATLEKLSGAKDAAAALHRALVPLLDYDARTGSDLARTLRIYVETGSVVASADRLFLHRNSVLYRLQRIHDLAGIDLQDRASRLVLLVAFALTDPTLLAGQLAAKAGHETEEVTR